MANLPANLAAKLAALKAQKTSESIPSTEEIKNEIPNESSGILPNHNSNDAIQSSSGSNGLVVSGNSSNNSSVVLSGNQESGKVSTSAIGFGSTQTVDINHLDFLSKLNDLQEQIHTQHPQMPLLLRTIHKQLLEDPELVTLLNEESIAVVVKGLEIHTKTELVSQATKEAGKSGKSKKIAVTEDMF